MKKAFVRKVYGRLPHDLNTVLILNNGDNFYSIETPLKKIPEYIVHIYDGEENSIMDVYKESENVLKICVNGNTYFVHENEDISQYIERIEEWQNTKC